MIKFDVKNRFNGNISFTAEIDCDEDSPLSIKLGLAVKWAIKSSADLSYTNLRSADLRSANLSYTNLRSADLRSANLSYTNLSSADLSYTNLSSADLSYTNLSYTNLRSADLRSANLRSANLRWALGTVHPNVKFIQIDTYHIVYTSDVICIGCEKHTIDEWREFDDERIIQMDGKSALKFWRKYKEFIFQAIELAPAVPTGFEETKEQAA